MLLSGRSRSNAEKKQGKRLDVTAEGALRITLNLSTSPKYNEVKKSKY